jgi:hypothetical protein
VAVGTGVSVGVGVAVSVAVGVGVSVSVGAGVGEGVSVAGKRFGVGGEVGRSGEGVTIGGVNPGNSSPRVGVGKVKVGSRVAGGVGDVAPAPGRCRMKSAAKPTR